MCFRMVCALPQQILFAALRFDNLLKDLRIGPFRIICKTGILHRLHGVDEAFKFQPASIFSFLPRLSFQKLLSADDLAIEAANCRWIKHHLVLLVAHLLPF